MLGRPAVNLVRLASARSRRAIARRRVRWANKMWWTTWLVFVVGYWHDYDNDNEIYAAVGTRFAESGTKAVQVVLAPSLLCVPRLLRGYGGGA